MNYIEAEDLIINPPNKATPRKWRKGDKIITFALEEVASEMMDTDRENIVAVKESSKAEEEDEEDVAETHDAEDGQSTNGEFIAAVPGQSTSATPGSSGYLDNLSSLEDDSVVVVAGLDGIIDKLESSQQQGGQAPPSSPPSQSSRGFSLRSLLERGKPKQGASTNSYLDSL